MFTQNKHSFMKLKTSLLFVLLGIDSIFSQISIPYSHTRNGDIILNQFNTFFNDEYGGTTIYLESEYDKFEKGFLKLKFEDMSKPAYIKFLTNKVNAKFSASEEFSTKIKAEDLEYFTTKVDSFFVAKNIQIKDKVISEPSIVQHIATFENSAFALYYDIGFNGIVKKKFFIRKTKDKGIWEKIDLKNDPERTFFIGFRAKEKYIDKKELSIEDFLNTIKIEKYSNNIEVGKSIFFDKQWRELENRKKAFYYASVNKDENDLFRLEVKRISDNRKQLDFKLSSLNPFKKSGEMIEYDGEGKVFSKRFYEDDKLKSYKVLGNNGYILSAIKAYDDDDELSSTTFNKIGENEINLTSTDTFNWKVDSLELEFKQNVKQLNQVRLLTDDAAMILYNIKNDVSQNFNSGNLDSALKNYIREQPNFKKERFNNDLEGTILLQLDTDYKGRVVNYEILNKLGSEMDEWVNSFCNKRMTPKSSSKIKFKGIKLEDKQARCRFLLPVNFQHRQFYKTFSRPNYNFHHFMFQQQWQQQWQMQQMNIPNIPSVRF